jgi:hypothetical protein
MNPDTQTNEVARLRELLERIYLHFQTAEHAEWCCMTIQTPCDCGIGNLCREIKAEITPAPEEAVIKESLTTEPAPEWRELGPDEVIQMDDMYRNDVSSRNYPVTSVMIGKPAGNFPFPEYSFRTRRPLPDPVPTQPPTQNEWRIRAEGERIEPLEKELDYLTSEASRAADIHNHVLIVDCLRYLRDEIEALKKNQK